MTSFFEKEREPFSEVNIKMLFEINPNKQNFLVYKETNYVEYKQSFHFEAFETHARTFAALANTNGGYLIFGVVDETREMVGLLDDKFEKLDPRIPTEYLNSKFAPEIHWASYITIINDKQFGVIYVWPSDNKPVVAISSGTRIVEGQIFYRYRGRTETIKYSELRNIFDEYRKKEQELWLRHLKRLATIGVENAAIFNPLDGTVTGKGGTFIIEASLLPKLQFIKEGDFRESEGAPAIRLVGDAEILAAGAIAATEYKLKPTLIREQQIIESFLNKEKVTSPSEFIKAACYESTPYLPIYNFALLANYDYIAMINFITETRGPGKQSLLNRISEDDIHTRYFSLPKSEEAASKRIVIKDSILKNEHDIVSKFSLTHLLEAIQLLSGEEIENHSVIDLLKNIYNNHWNEKSAIRSYIRKTICHVDYMCYKHLLNSKG